MKVSCLKVSALAAASLALMGCASSPLVRIGLLGAAHGIDPLSTQGSVATAAISDPEETLREARRLRKAADFQAAERLLSQLVVVLPEDARVLGEYAKTLIALNRPSDGLTYVDRAIALEPDDWTLHSARGVALDQKKDYAAAQLSYARALALKPGDPIVLSNAALSHMQSGDLAGAESLLIQASQAGYENPRIASNLAMVRGMRATSQPSPAPAAQPTAIASAPAAAKPPVAPRAQSKTEVASSVAAAQGGTPVSASTLGNTAQASGKPASVRPAAAVIQSAPSSAETLRAASAVLPPAAPKDGKTDVAPLKKTAKKDIPTALLLRPALTEGRPIALASDQTK